MKMIWNSKKFDNKALDETLERLKELEVVAIIDDVPVSWFKNKKFKVFEIEPESRGYFLKHQVTNKIFVISKRFLLKNKLKKWIKRGLELE